MFLKHIYLRVRGWLRSGRGISEGACMQADVDRLDAECAGWDRDARLARAQTLLKNGMTREDAAAIYDEEIVREAEHRNRREPSP